MSVVRKVRESLKHSLSYFEPKELEILLLTTIKTTLYGAWLMLKYFFPLIIFGAYIEMVVEGPALFGRLWEYATPFFLTHDVRSKVFGGTLLLLIFLVILSVRASLQAKKTGYFVQFFPRIILFSVLFVLLPQLFLFPALWCVAFFFFDAGHSLSGWLRSLYNGLLLIIGYAPFIAFIGVFNGVLYHLHNFIWSLIYIEAYFMTAYSLKFVTSGFLYMFFVAMLGNFYTRVKHSNAKLFLKGKKGPAKKAQTAKA